MNIINKITVNTLKQNKTRTLVTIIGIILSAAMITAVITFISSLQNYMYEITASQTGTWHGSADVVGNDKINEILGNEGVESCVLIENIGYAKLEDANNPRKPYLYVGGFSEFNETLPVKVLEGRLPKNSSEILLPQHLMESEETGYKIGDEITLDLGNRILNGNEIGQFTSYISQESAQEAGDSAGEILTITKQAKYKIVGIYNYQNYEPYSAPGYTLITKSDIYAPGTTANNDTTYQSYVTMKEPKDIYDFFQNTLKDYITMDNDDLLMVLGVSQYDNFYPVLYSMATILIILIVVGSVSLIYNAFSISVSERTKQMGLLSSIGATKKQLKRSVRFEALVLGAIGIPLGILAGIGGIAVTLYLISDLFATIINSSSVNFSVHVNWIYIIAALIISLITILISAFIPSIRASKVSPVETIRMSSDIKVKANKLRTSRIITKLFGLPGMLADKNFKRNKKKYRSTVISLTMSMLLFVTISSYTGSLLSGMENVFDNPPYDIMAFGEEGISGADLKNIDQLLTSVSGVDKGAYFSAYGGEIVGAESDSSGSLEYGVLYAIEDEEFKEFTSAAGIDSEKYFSNETPSAAVFDRINRYDSDSGRFIEKVVFEDHTPGDVKIKDPNANYIDIKAADFVDELPFGAEALGGSEVLFIMPMSRFDELIEWLKKVSEEAEQTNEVEQTAEVNSMFVYKAENHAEAVIRMRELTKEYNLTFVDIAEQRQNSRNLITVANVFSYGFIILISLIAVANVFNTISTNIGLRRKEFAMLRSVGMTLKGFNKMMNMECIMYGLKSIVYGLPLSILIAWLINRSMNYGVDVAFTLPWLNILIAVLSIFFVVFITMAYSMRRIKKENTIDALKSENF